MVKGILEIIWGARVVQGCGSWDLICIEIVAICMMIIGLERLLLDWALLVGELLVTLEMLLEAVLMLGILLLGILLLDKTLLLLDKTLLFHLWIVKLFVSLLVDMSTNV